MTSVIMMTPISSLIMMRPDSNSQRLTPGRFVLTIFALCHLSTLVASSWTYRVTWPEGEVTSFTYPTTPFGDCLYDRHEDRLICMRNHGYDHVVATWVYDPEMIVYVSVRCLQPHPVSLTRPASPEEPTCLCKGKHHATASSSSSSKEETTKKATTTMTTTSRSRRATAAAAESFYQCQLHNVTHFMLQELQHLEVLDLAHNRLEAFPDPFIFRPLVSLKVLSLSHNPLRRLPQGLFCPLTSLHVLDLKGMQLTEFPGQAFRCDSKSVLAGNASIFTKPLPSPSPSPAPSPLLPSPSSPSSSTVRWLDVSQNHLTAMPEASLWYLGNVTFLNLSGNLLETLPPYPLLGAPALVSIDLSSNLLRELPEGSSFCEGDAGLRRLELRSNLFDNFSLAALNTCRNLSHLDLSGNVLSGLTGPSARLPELRFLSLARNRLTALDNPLLDCGGDGGGGQNSEDLDRKTGRSIKKERLAVPDPKQKLESFLSLARNRLTALDNPLLDCGGNGGSGQNSGDLDRKTGITCNLKNLDLSHNDLTSVTVDALGNLVTLETLSLLSNALNESDGLDLSRVFMRLSKLKSLNLARNLLTTVSTDHFAGLSSLETLDLSHNKITTVNFDSTTSLTLLTHLNLSSNQLTTFPARAALALTSLRVLDISVNNLHHVTEVSLPQSILSVDLSTNALRVFPKFVLLPGTDLQKVNVAFNLIGGLDENDLKALGSLRHLDVSRNALSFIHQASFSSLLRLRVLLLSHNRLDVNTTLAQHLFTPLVSLRMLSLSHNRISDAMALLPPGTLTTLVDLDASFNAIGQIPRRLSQWNGTMHLEHLRLEGCRLREVNEDAFAGLIYLRSVNIRHNLITRLPLFRSHPGVQYLLRGNPITCSCHVGWLKQTLVNVGGRIVSTQDYEVGECRTLPRGHLRAVRDILRRDFLCVLPPALPACPPNCTCYSQIEDGDPEVIFCAGVGATSVPDVPPSTRVLSLEGGWIEKVGSIAGDEREDGGEGGVQRGGRVLWYLEELYLNNSGVLTLSPTSFQGLPSLSVLELASNRLTGLPSGVFQGLSNLTSLSLRGNRLTELPGNLFKDLKKLQALDLSHNVLSSLSSSIVAELKAMPGLQRLSLAHNLWLCECRNSALYHWLKGNVSRADDYDVMSCKDEQTGLRLFFNEEEKVEGLFHCEEEDDDFMVATVVLVIVFVVVPLIAALAFLGYKYRKIVSALLYSRCGCKCVKKKNEHEEMMVADRIVYDVCVLYDHSDRKCQWWVERILVPRLQSLSNGLRVHVPGLQQVGGARGRVIQWQASSVPGSRGGTEDRRGMTDINICGLRQSLACLVIVSKYFGAHTHTVTSFAQAAEQSQLRPSSLVMVTWGELTKQTLECGVRDFLGHSQHLPITAPFFWDRLLFLLPVPQRTPSHPSWHQLRRHSQSLIRACRFRSLSDVSAPSTEDRSTSTEFTDVTHHL